MREGVAWCACIYIKELHICRCILGVEANIFSIHTQKNLTASCVYKPDKLVISLNVLYLQDVFDDHEIVGNSASITKLPI